MLIFVRKKNIFEYFSDILPHTITIKVRGQLFFNQQALKKLTKDIYHTTIAQL